MREDQFEEQIMQISDLRINYLKIGNGEHPILLLPGTLGAIWLGFGHQLEGLDGKRFTIVAWDPPGYGNSRPPSRTFPEDVFQRDATLANDLMHALGYETFSMIGWCNGGRTACILASMYPDSVRRMVLVGTNSFLLPEEMEKYKSRRDLQSWPKYVLYATAAIYGYSYVKSVWRSWTDMLIDLCEKQNGDICSNILGKIKCQTLIVQGEGDVLVHESHSAFLNQRIQHSRVEIIENGRHDPHLRFPKEFNDLVTNFLSSS